MIKAVLLAGIVSAVSLLAPTGATAADVTVGDLTISKVWMRSPPKGAAVAGGYLNVLNKGKAADKLVSGSSPIAGVVEIHEMKMDGGVMKMRAVPGLEIQPGATLELKPGGYHVMFMQLKEQPTAGGKVKATLQFEKAGKVDVEFAVEAMGAKGGAKGSGSGKGSGSH